MKKTLSIFILILIIAGCQNDIVYKQTKDINETYWHKDSIVSLQFMPQQQDKAYDLFFLIRNDETYPYANIFLIAEISTPEKKIIDTLEYTMADAEGNWLGSGIWDLKESKLEFKRNYRFKDIVPVKISVQHAVRKSGQILGDEKLPGIKTVGIIIEEAKK